MIALLALLVLVGCTTSSPPSATIVAAAPAPGVLEQRTKTSGCAISGGLPDHACTPGAADPRVSQATIGSTICTRGYTAAVRPPENITERIKRDQMAAYGLKGQRVADYELDHLVSLELGGAPADVANLWPQPWTGEGNAHMKDAVENFLNREVCRGAMPLTTAQQQIASDWLTVYRSHTLQPAP